MTGLDKMVNQILEEANTLASEKEAEAKAKAEEILSQARKEADSMKASILEKSEKDAADYENRAKSSDEQKRRTALLAAKQEIIADMMEKAYEKFCGMETSEYFAAIRTMIAKFAFAEEGTILFSKKDLERMPAGFEAEIAKAAEEKGGKLTLSDKTREMDGGFILVYGGIEENCTFRALFDSRKDALQDQVQKILF